MKNNYLYQGNYAEYDEDIGWHDFALRSYDAQIGRFWQPDPYYEFASSYTGMGNDPVNLTDPSGGWVFSAVPLIEHGAWAIGGAAIGAVVAGATNGWDSKAMTNGALIGGSVGLGASFVNWGAVGSAIGNAGQWVGNQLSGLFQNPSSYWILYDGLKVTTYSGSYGSAAKSTQVNQYAGTSGGTGYQNSNNQNIPNAGPVPEGDYSINLKPDFTRKAKTNSDGSTKSNPDGGVELLPWGNGTLYSEWGQWRARLDKVNVNSTRNDFYFHDSYKGYSHGCIETNTALYYDLSAYKKGGQKAIKVQIKYSPNSSTNGGTKQFPPPWWDGKPMYKSPDGRYWPKPKIGSFP